MHATYQCVKQLFIWSELKHKVEEIVKQCGLCQQAKHEHCPLPGKLQPLPVPGGAWKDVDVTMDFIEGLPKSEGYDVILVVVDIFSKYAHFMPLKHPYSAPQVARLFLDNVVKLHGMPLSIASDRDMVFTSHFWKELFQLMDVKLKMT